MENIIQDKNINKGTGAGGANTNYNGKNFEKLTCIENKLLENNFTKITMGKNKTDYYFEKKDNENKILYFTQGALKLYLMKTYNIVIYRNPDEAFLIYHNNKYHLKIIEKKNQNGAGSVDEKFKTGRANIREYIHMINDKIKLDTISYAFVVNKWLEDKFKTERKFQIMKKIMDEDNIMLFYGESENYIDNIYNWVVNTNVNVTNTEMEI